jgi:hypothetical protein
VFFIATKNARAHEMGSATDNLDLRAGLAPAFAVYPAPAGLHRYQCLQRMKMAAGA